MSHKINLLCKYLFCYHCCYSYTSEATCMPLRNSLRTEIIDCGQFGLRLIRFAYSDHRVTSVFHCGSQIETLTVPPVIRKNILSRKGTKQEDIELVEGGDYDVMIEMKEIVSEENKSVDRKFEINAELETIPTTPGYLRLRLLKSKCSEHILPRVFDFNSKNYYLKSDACDSIISLDLEDMIKEISEREEWPSLCFEHKIKGPARKLRVHAKIKEPKHETDLPRYSLTEVDIVGAFKYSKWPSVAEEWIKRERFNGWPSREMIETIRLSGCHIVGTSHPLSQSPDIEFRFSFSNAENVLAETFSYQQKQCYTSFKAIMKNEIRQMEDETGLEMKLKSYHLKNVFLWACESISQEDWTPIHQWSKCLLFLFEQLLHCLKTRNVPGYFIRKSNLLDGISDKVTNILIKRIIEVRTDPLSAAIRFLKTTVLYRPENICLERVFARVLAPNAFSESSEEEICIDILKCWQRLIVEFDLSENARFGKKASIYEAFANWCRTATTTTRLSDCLSHQFSVFDVVFLDIVHNFDVDESIIKAFAIHEPSDVVKSKLIACYREFVCGEKAVVDINIRNAFIRKTRILHELSRGARVTCDIMEFAIFMYEIESYNECIESLESLMHAIQDAKFDAMWLSRIGWHFITNIFEHKIDCIIRGENGRVPIMSIAALLFSLCHINMNTIEKVFPIVKIYEQYCKGLDYFENHLSFYILGFCQDVLGMKENASDCFKMALQSKLMTVTGQFCKCRKCVSPLRIPCPHADIPIEIGLFILGIMGSEVQTRDMLKMMRRDLSEIRFSGSSIFKVIFYMTSKNMFHIKWTNMLHCENCCYCFNSLSLLSYIFIIVTRRFSSHHISSSSNLLYYAHYVMHFTVDESIVSILQDVITREEDAPLSVIIWPKQFRPLTDDCIGKELDKTGDRGFIAIPSISYAYYLLAKAYMRMGKTDSYVQTIIKFKELCDRIGDVSSISCSLLEYAYQHQVESENLEISRSRQESNICYQNTIVYNCLYSFAARIGQSQMGSFACGVDPSAPTISIDDDLMFVIFEYFCKFCGILDNHVEDVVCRSCVLVD